MNIKGEIVQDVQGETKCERGKYLFILQEGPENKRHADFFTSYMHPHE